MNAIAATEPPKRGSLEHEPVGWLSEGGAGTRFGRGFSLPFRSLKLIARHGNLRRWSIVTALVSGVLLFALFVGLLFTTDDVVGWLWTKPEGWLAILWWALAFLVFGVLFAVGASTVPTIATAPFADPLTAAAERVLGAPVEDGGGVAKMAFETAHSIGKSILRLSLLWAGHAFLLLFWLLPGVGQVIWTALAFGWTVFWLAYEYLDLPANRHGYRFSEVVGAVRRNLWVSAGFGCAVYLILWVPLLNALFIPVAAVGATVLFVDLRRTGRMAPSRAEQRSGRSV